MSEVKRAHTGTRCPLPDCDGTYFNQEQTERGSVIAHVRGLTCGHDVGQLLATLVERDDLLRKAHAILRLQHGDEKAMNWVAEHMRYRNQHGYVGGPQYVPMEPWQQPTPEAIEEMKRNGTWSGGSQHVPMTANDQALRRDAERFQRGVH